MNVPVQLNICELRSTIIRPHATFIRIFAEKLSFEHMCYFINLQNLIEIYKTWLLCLITLALNITVERRYETGIYISHGIVSKFHF